MVARRARAGASTSGPVRGYARRVEVEIEGVRVLAVGAELRLTGGVYRVVCVEPFDELGEARAPLERLALAHGAVAFELLPAHPDDDPVAGALLRVRGAWVVVEMGGAVVGLATASGESDTGWRLVTLLADGMVGEEPTSEVGEVRGRDDGGWEGEGLRVRPHPLLIDRPLRDWAWSWGRSTIGPGMLTVRFAWSRDEIAAFLVGCAPMPYVYVEDGRYKVPVRGPTAVFQELRIFDGGLVLMRDYHAPPDELVAFDGGLLVALEERVGALVWDVVEGDWGAYLATGHTGASLVEYLDPAVDADGLVAGWREVFAVRRVDASAAVTPAEVIGVVAKFLGGPEVADGEFDAWLAARPVAGLPRRVEVTLAAAFEARHGTQWFFDRVFAAQPRLSWSIRRG